MEDTLRVTMRHLLVARLRSLNPCFNGRYSQSREDFLAYLESKKVLILVLMEDTLRVFFNY